MNEKVMCHKCGKYEAEQCFTICEFCMGISDEKEYSYKQLQSYKDKEEEYKQIIGAMEIIKECNMPNDTQFVIMAKEDYLRNLGILNEGDGR